MTEVIDLPPIEADMLAAAPPAPRTDVAVASAAALDLQKIDLTDVALAQFGDWRKDVAAVVANIGTLALDLSIQSRIDEAKTLRNRLIGQPRADIRKVSKELKSKLAKVSKAIGAEEDAAVLAYDEAEKPLTAQIDAAQKKIDDAKEAARQAENVRLAGLREAVDGIMAKWLERCTVEGITAERIAKGGDLFSALPMPAEVADVSVYWDTKVGTTLAEMRKLHGSALAREEAARLEAQRIENERIAAEQRAEAERLAALKAEVEHQERELLAKSAFHAAWERCGAERAYAIRDAYIALDPDGRAIPRDQYAAYIEALTTLTPAAPVATAAATEGKADNPEPCVPEAATITTKGAHDSEAATAGAYRAGEAPRLEAVAQDAAGEPAADPGLGGRDSERGSGVVDSEHGSGVDPADAAGHAGRGDETGGSIAALNPTSVAAPRHDPWIGHAESAAYGPDLLDPVTAAIEAEAPRVILLEPAEPSAAMKAVAELARLRDESWAGPMAGAEWWSRFYAAVETLEFAAYQGEIA